MAEPRRPALCRKGVACHAKWDDAAVKEAWADLPKTRPKSCRGRAVTFVAEPERVE